jgi:hypothetical protein
MRGGLLMVGIFWVYKGSVIGKAVDVANRAESVPGIVDSPDNHTDFWDTDKEFKQQFPELKFREYFEVPRGRVLYNRKKGQPIVYMDKVLFDDQMKQLITEFFSLQDVNILWRTDLHYTTSVDELDRLLD